jgi:hypothetical protein
MLGEDDHLDLHATAAKADKLWAVHAHQQHGTVASWTPLRCRSRLLPLLPPLRAVFCPRVAEADLNTARAVVAAVLQAAGLLLCLSTHVWLCTHCRQPPWPGSWWAFASTTGRLERRWKIARVCVPGRKTNLPGVSQRRDSRLFGPCAGPDLE